MPRHASPHPDAGRRVTVPADLLRDLARRVERLGVAGRCTPETVLLAKMDVAGELRALAGAGR